MPNVIALSFPAATSLVEGSPPSIAPEMPQTVLIRWISSAVRESAGSLFRLGVLSFVGYILRCVLCCSLLVCCNRGGYGRSTAEDEEEETALVDFAALVARIVILTFLHIRAYAFCREDLRVPLFLAARRGLGLKARSFPVEERTRLRGLGCMAR